MGPAFSPAWRAWSSWVCECGASNSSLTPDFCPICGQHRGGYIRQTTTTSESYNDTDDTSDTTGASSIWSRRDSNTTASSLESLSLGETENSLSEELENLIWEYPHMEDLLLYALTERVITGDQLERKVRRLLKQMAISLRHEASNLEQRRIAKFIALKSRAVAEALHRKADDALIQLIPARDGKSSLKPRHKQTDTQRSREQSDLQIYESSPEDDTDQEDDQDNKNDLARLKGFIVGSFAFATFSENLQDFVHPTLKSLLLKSAERLANVKVDDEKQSWITAARALARELYDIDHSSISIIQMKDLGHFDHLQRRIEAWTGEGWDWWPFNKPSVPHGIGIQWICTCGEKRWIECPASLATSVVQVTKYLASYSGTGATPEPFLNQAPLSLPPRAQSANRSAYGSPSVPTDFRRGQQPRASTMARNVTSQTPLLSKQWALLVVQARGDYKLAQIKMHGLTSISFFVHLRSEYFRLRGSFLRYFSVWCFSHCDFYKFEKFDEHAVTPRQKDQYPDPRNQDYDYFPKQIVDMPPMTPHEFKTRFYSCTPSPLHFRCYKNCECVKIRKKAHNREIIDLLPKKLSQLDVGSDQKEIFWGLYARDEVRFCRVFAYNVVCISPLMWFFFMWFFFWGHGGDMQGASVPLMVMLALLSMFWMTFIASLQPGEEREVS